MLDAYLFIGHVCDGTFDHKMTKLFFILHTIPIVASSVFIEKSTYIFEKKREIEENSKKEGSIKNCPRNSSRRIIV